MNNEDLIFSQLLSNEDYVRAVIPHLKEEYFSSVEEQTLFKTYSEFFQKYNKVPSKSAMLVEIESLKGSADTYSGMKEIINRNVEFTDSLEYLVSKTEAFVKERALFNALRESVLLVDGTAKNKSGKTVGSIPSILQEALSICFDTSVGHDYLADAMARYDYYHLSEARIPSGVPEFDLVTKGGFPRKTFNLLLAPPHGGKSLVMSNFGAGALLAGYDVLVITMEMSEFEFGKRFDVQLMGIDFDTLAVLPKTTFSGKMAKILEKSRGKLIVKEFPTGGAHAGNFKSLLAELKTKQNFIPDLIIVDYMGITASERYKVSSGANSYTIQKSVGEELRAIAIEYNCAVVSAIQTNRSGVNSSDIGMENISESLGPAMIADFIAAIIVTDELIELKQVMFKLIKNRYGGIAENNKFLMGIDYKKMRLFSLENSAIPKLEQKRVVNGLNKKSVTEFDPTHQIQPTPANFSDFNFD